MKLKSVSGETECDHPKEKVVPKEYTARSTTTVGVSRTTSTSHLSLTSLLCLECGNELELEEGQ